MTTAAAARSERPRLVLSFRSQMKSNLDEGALRSELSRIFRIRGPEEEPTPDVEPAAREKAAG